MLFISITDFTTSQLRFFLKEEMKTQPKLDVPSVSVGEILEKSTNNVKRSPSNPGDQFSAKGIELTASECPRLLKKGFITTLPKNFQCSLQRMYSPRGILNDVIMFK